MVAARSVRDHRLQLLDDARLNEDARLLVRDRHVEHLGEHLAFQVRQAARAMRLFRLQATTTRRRATALRVAFNQGDKAVIGQLLVFGAQAPACRRVAFQARAQALVEKKVASVVSDAADKADMTFQ